MRFTVTLAALAGALLLATPTTADAGGLLGWLRHDRAQAGSIKDAPAKPAKAKPAKKGSMKDAPAKPTKKGSMKDAPKKEKAAKPMK